MRSLDVGDFAIVNEVFKDFQLPIDLDDEPLEIEIGSIGKIIIDITNLICYDINVGDIILSYNKLKETSIEYVLNVIKTDVECEFDYAYRAAPIFRGEGSAVILASDNRLNMDILLSQDSGKTPNIVEASNCEIDVSIDEATFDGGIVAFILNLVEGAILGYISNIVEDFVCEKALELDERAVDLLANITTVLEPYLEEESLENNNPLAPEEELLSDDDNYKTLNNSTNNNFINLQEPNNSSVSTAVDFLLDQVGDLLSNERNDTESPKGNGKDLGINVLLRSFLLNDDRIFDLNTSLPVVDVHNASLVDVEIRLDYLKIAGLDTFNRFDPFDAIGLYTLQADFAWDYIQIEADIFIAIGPPNDKKRVEESIRLSTSFRDLNFTLASLFAVSEDVGDIEIGQILQMENILPCFMTNVGAINISSLLVSIGYVDDLYVQDFESPGLGRVINTFVQGLYELYDDILLTALRGAFQTTIRERLNVEIIEQLVENATCGISPIEEKEVNFIDFRDLFLSQVESIENGGSGSAPYGNIGVLVRDTVDEFLNDVDNVTGIPKINNFISDFLDEGTFFVSDPLLDLSVGNVSIENFEIEKFILKADNLRIENIDTVLNPLILLEPSDRYKLYNEVGFGGDGSRPLRIAAKVLVEIQNDDVNIRDEVDISLSFNGGLQLSATILIQMLVQRFFTIPIIDVLDWNCWLAAIPSPKLNKQGVRSDGVDRTAGIVDIDLLLQNLTLDVDCIDCTSQAFYELTELLQSKDKNGNITTRIVTDLFKSLTELLDGEFLQIFIDRAIHQAPSRCPHSPLYDPTSSYKFEPYPKIDVPGDSITFILISSLSILAVLLLALLARSGITCFVRRRHRAWIKTLSSAAVYKIYCKQKKEDKKEFYLKKSTSSMFASEEDIPASVRYGIPLLLLANIALFLSGHFNLGGAISVFINFAGEDIIIDRLFAFSVVRAIIQLWEGGATELAILIFIFSGIWPYTKQLLTLVAWFLPPHKLSVQRRGSIFIWLDALAKWSSVDIFFLVVFIVAFNIQIRNPKSDLLPDNFYSVDIQLVPLWGLYATLIAQVLSQLSSHIIIHYHRKLVANATSRMRKTTEVAHISTAAIIIEEENNQSIIINNENHEGRLCEHNFVRPHRGNSRLTVRFGVTFFLAITSIALITLVIIGCIFPAFSFEQLGVLGVAVELGQNFKQAENYFGIFTIVKTLIDQGRQGSLGTTVGMTAIAILVLLTVLIIPIVQCCALFYLWFASVTRVQKRKIQIWIEIFSSWQYIEVFLIAIMVSSWQLGETSEYLINAYCANLQDDFSMLVNFGILSEDDAQCFRLRGFIREGSSVLLGVAFGLAFMNSFIMRAADQYNYDNLEKDQQIYPDNVMTSSSEPTKIDNNTEDMIQKIKPAPVLFTDIFRWFLRRNPEENKTNEEKYHYTVGDNTNNVSLPIINETATHTTTTAQKRAALVAGSASIITYEKENDNNAVEC